MMNHESWMRRAIELSLEGLERGRGGPFGAVIVKDGVIIGEGNNQVTSTNDPTAHAEIVAIRNACRTIHGFSLENTTLYTSCEPCPMCLSAIYWARIGEVYFANRREDAASIDFDDALIYEEVALPINKRSLVMKPLLRDEAFVAFKKWQSLPNKIAY